MEAIRFLKEANLMSSEEPERNTAVIVFNRINTGFNLICFCFIFSVFIGLWKMGLEQLSTKLFFIFSALRTLKCVEVLVLFFVNIDKSVCSIYHFFNTALDFNSFTVVLMYSLSIYILTTSKTHGKVVYLYQHSLIIIFILFLFSLAASSYLFYSSFQV